MLKFNFIKTLTTGVVLATAFYPQAFALTMNEILTIMTAGNNGTRYYNNDENNSYSYVSVDGQFSWGITYGIFKNDPKDSSNNKDAFDGFTRINATVNGVPVEGKTPDIVYKTYDFDENGKLQAIYNDTYYSGHNGELLESYKYADDGQMLVYNPSGELIGAYNNWYEKQLTREGFYDHAAELNHLVDGKYTAKDEDNNILGVYYQNGDYSKNTYNSEGNLISSNKYDKDGNVLESSINKYDGAGNLTAAYENGVSTYKKTSYTPVEAAAAVKKGNKNKVTLTFK